MNATKSPAQERGLFGLRRNLVYLLRPEPGPVGVKVDPLGEPLGASVFPDGFMVVLEPPLAPPVRPTVEPGGLLIEFPVADEPVLGATELPAPEVPPAAAPPL